MRRALGVVKPRAAKIELGAGRSQLQGYRYEEDEHDQHDDGAQRELPGLAPKGADLRATGPDGQACLVGPGGMPH